MGFWSSLKDKFHDAANAANDFQNKVVDSALNVPLLRENILVSSGVVRGLTNGVTTIADQTAGRISNRITNGNWDATNWSESAMDAVTLDRLEPENLDNYERGWMTAGHVTGEAGAIIGATVATGGTGGALFGAARGGSLAMRATSAGSTASNWAGNTARFMNPLDMSTKMAAGGTALGLGLEGLHAKNVYAEMEQAGVAIDEQTAQYLEYKAGLIEQEKQTMLNRLEQNSPLPESEMETMRQRLAQLNESEDIIQKLGQENISYTEQQELTERLDEMVPGQPEPQNTAQNNAAVQTNSTANTAGEPEKESDPAAASGHDNTDKDVAANPVTAATKTQSQTAQQTGTQEPSIQNQFHNAVDDIMAESQIVNSLNTLLQGVFGWIQNTLEGLAREFGHANSSVIANNDDRLGIQSPDSQPAPDPQQDPGAVNTATGPTVAAGT